MPNPSLPPTGFRPLRPGDVPTEVEVIINSPEGMPFIGPRESIGLPPSKKPVGMGDLYPPPPTTLEKVGKFTKDVVVPGVLPTAGGALGGAVGHQIVPGPGGVVGTSIGSMAGEAANQALGITEPSVMSVGLSGALPMLPAALRGAIANTPGAEAGLQRLATQVARGIPGRLGPRVDYGDLYEAAKQAGAAIPKAPIARAHADVVLRESITAPELRLPKVNRAIKGVWSLMGQPGPDVSLENLLPNLQRLGDLYGFASRRGGPEKKAIATLLGGVQEALDEAAAKGTGPGIKYLREANAAFKRHLAEEEMGSLIRIKYVGGHPQPNADAVLAKLDEGSEVYQQLRRWVPEKELADIKETLTVLSKIAPVSPAGRGGVGGLQFAQRAVVSGAIGATIAGGPLGAAGGVIAAEALTRVMMSAGGRAAVKLIASSRIGGKGATFDQIINAALQFATPRPKGPVMLGQMAAPEGTAQLQDIETR